MRRFGFALAALAAFGFTAASVAAAGTISINTLPSVPVAMLQQFEINCVGGGCGTVIVRVQWFARGARGPLISEFSQQWGLDVFTTAYIFATPPPGTRYARIDVCNAAGCNMTLPQFLARTSINVTGPAKGDLYLGYDYNTSSLVWEGSKVNGCQASGSWSGSKDSQGMEPAGSGNFVLECNVQGGGRVKRTVTRGLFVE